MNPNDEYAINSINKPRRYTHSTLEMVSYSKSRGLPSILINKKCLIIPQRVIQSSFSTWRTVRASKWRIVKSSKLFNMVANDVFWKGFSLKPEPQNLTTKKQKNLKKMWNSVKLKVLFNQVLKSLTLRHCLRFSQAEFPGGAEAYIIRGRTAWMREG